MGSRLGILDFKDHRCEQGLNSASSWAKQREIDVDIVPRNGLHKLPGDLRLLYVPITGNFDFLAELPLNLPLVVDLDIIFLKRLVQHLGGRSKVAVRVDRELKDAAASAFGVEVLPYLHLPPPANINSANARDVVMIDCHFWNRPDYHFQVMAFLALLDRSYRRICDRIGTELWIYLTSEISFDLYGDTFRFFSDSWTERFQVSFGSLENLKSKLIAPFPTGENAEFQRLFARTRLFVTDHRHITDATMFTASTAGGNVLALWNPGGDPRDRYCPFWFRDVVEGLEPSIKVALDYFERRVFYTLADWPDSLLTAPPGPLHADAFTRAYYNTWDYLWNWSAA